MKHQICLELKIDFSVATYFVLALLLYLKTRILSNMEKKEFFLEILCTMHFVLDVFMILIYYYCCLILEMARQTDDKNAQG